MQLDWFLLVIAGVAVASGMVLVHYHGYKLGHKDGFELGKKRINKYALKVNEAQGERIKELESQRHGDINKIVEFLSK